MGYTSAAEGVKLTDNQRRAYDHLVRLSPRFKQGWVPRRYLVGPGSLVALERKGLIESLSGARGGRGAFYRPTVWECENCAFETTSAAAAIQHTDASRGGGHLTTRSTR
jgi:hypothetical protein